MKRIKITIMTLAIIFSIGAAFGTKPPQDCTASTQYFQSGGNYLNAGVMGVNYACVGTIGVCTYTKSGNTYTGCQAGTYTAIGIKNKQSNSK